MGDLSRVAGAILVLLALAAAGCSGAGDDPVSGAADLPDGVLVQMWIPDTGELYRVAEDGRYLVTLPGAAEAQQQPRSRFEPGATVVSARGLDRLRAALGASGFFTLPARIATGDCVSDDTVIRNSGRKVLRRRVVISARDGHRVATVEGLGDLAAPCTLAELEPVYRALDLEALGDWQNE